MDFVESGTTDTAPDSKVYQAANERDVDRLCLYETTAYEVIRVDIGIEGIVVKGNVLKYSGNHKLALTGLPCVPSA